VPRLLYVVTLAEVGGAQTYVAGLLPAARQEYEVTVAAHGEGPLRRAAAQAGVPFVPLEHVRRAVSPVRDVRGLLELYRLFRRLRPDVVHLNSSKAGILGRLAARLARVPVCVFTAHGWAFKAGHGRAAHAYLWADRLVEPLTSTVVCVSETELRAGLEAGTCRVGRSVVIPNAVEPGPAVERPPRDRPVEIVSVGRLAEPKDFATLVAALAGLPRGAARLLVLGDGPLRARLAAEVRALGLDDAVELAGEVDDVRARLERADVFALSSRSEGMPLSVLEAMAAGLPVVASDVGGVHEVVVEGETGRLVAAGDVEALREALASLVFDAGLRERLGRGGRERVLDRFALPHWRERHLELYRRLVAGRTAEDYGREESCS
jgi:glycosyltransferase involved in cell wall biosynthesis